MTGKPHVRFGGRGRRESFPTPIEMEVHGGCQASCRLNAHFDAAIFTRDSPFSLTSVSAIF